MSEKLTTEGFISKARKIHGDKYDYSKVEYKDYQTKVCIICPTHGEFWQTPSNHLNKTRPRGCLKCGIETTNHKNTYTQEKFIEKAKKVHGDKYDYSKVNYVSSNVKVCIICPKHGEFWQTPASHLNGNGCPYCSNNAKMNSMVFIEKALQTHNKTYDYSKVKYINTQTPVCIICPIHGEFWQTPNNHISKHECCPKCNSNISKKEEELRHFIEEIDKDCEIIVNDKTIIPPFELDIYIPRLNLGIEFNGNYWHSEIKRDKNYHLAKTLECEKNGIRLIHIYEDEWDDKKDIVKDILLKAFNKGEKIYGRKCVLKEISLQEARDFINSNHIQGYAISKINIGLYYNDELVSVMTFGKKRINLGSKVKDDKEYELIRFSNKIGVSVIGGASKMFNYFMKKYCPRKIISYCDRRLFNGNIYEILGFKFTHYSSPNYYYVIRDKRENRFKYRKNVLIEQGFDKNKSEHQIMMERGIYRIYDCGCKCFIYENE